MRTVPRVRSTQKLPSIFVLTAARPRTSAIATAIPTAAERKFCTASPAICTVYPTVSSGEYACQLVLLTNEIAVFQDSAGSTGGRSSEYGRNCCTLWSR